MVPGTGSGHSCAAPLPSAGLDPQSPRGWLWIDSLAFEEREGVTMGAAAREGEEEAGDVPWAFPEIPEKLCSGFVRKNEVTNGPVLVLSTGPCGHPLCVLSRASGEKTPK